MKLFIQRNHSADNIVFTIFDYLGKEKYEIIHTDSKNKNEFYISDINKNIKVGRIRRFPIPTANVFSIAVNRRHITFACLPLSHRLKCCFYGINWFINGNPVTKNYSIIDVDNSLIAVHTKTGANCELEICREADELDSIAVAVCINLINTVDNFATQAV